MLKRLHRLLAAQLAAPARCMPVHHWVLGYGESERNFLMRLRKRCWRRLTEPLMIRWLEHLQIQVHPDSELGRNLYLTGIFEPNEFLMLRCLIKPGMQVIDAGANIGLYSLYISRLTGSLGQLYAFEPSSREYHRLLENIRLNQIENIHAERKALTGGQGLVQLRIADDLHGGHNTLGEFAWKDTRLARVEEVPGVSIDEYVELKQLPRIDLIKMDVEGSEADLLRGSIKTLKRDHPMLLLELSVASLESMGANPQGIICLLTELEYQIYSIATDVGAQRIGLCRVMPTDHTQYQGNVLAIHHTQLERLDKEQLIWKR